MVGSVEVGFAYQSAVIVAFDGSGFVTDSDSLGLSASFDAGVVVVAAAYSSTDIDHAPDSINLVHLAVSAPVGQSTAANTGFESIDAGANGPAGFEVSDQDCWYLIAIYQFPNATDFRAFAEIGNTDIDGVFGIDVGYLTDLRLKFLSAASS